MYAVYSLFAIFKSRNNEWGCSNKVLGLIKPMAKADAE